jgi:hypothetical protein
MFMRTVGNTKDSLHLFLFHLIFRRMRFNAGNKKYGWVRGFESRFQGQNDHPKLKKERDLMFNVFKCWPFSLKLSVIYEGPGKTIKYVGFFCRMRVLILLNSLLFLP